MTQIGALRRLFDIAREDSLASWFACTQTLLLGLTLGFIWLCKKNQPNRQREALGWLILTRFFLYMAVDDGAQIHERLGTVFKKTMEQAGNNLDFFPSYTWQIIFLPVFVGLGVFTYYFLWNQLTEKISAHFISGIDRLLCVCGGFGFYRRTGGRAPFEHLYLDRGLHGFGLLDDTTF